MISSLAPLFAGDLEALGDHLVLAADERPHMACSALLEKNRLALLLNRFGENYAEAEPRAVASQWSKWYLSRLVTPVLAANIVLDRKLPIGFEETGIILSPDGRAEAFRLRDGGQAFTPSDFMVRFEDLIDGHLSLIIPALSAASGLSQKVLWSNAGNIIENVVASCARKLGEEHAGVIHARQLLSSRSWRDRQPNRVFEPVRYSASGGETVRKRRVCCIRYLIPSLSLCKTCPLDERPAKRAGLPR
ncbi:siderophore-iron reductase FhuF [Rhizobium sp. LCM 4573]|uniref:siderophore-iron reductase FhuF n=1 Tax=Rhizobium sp. LCM 4573 TaxID=1848291 RepID=UPI0008DA8D3B|nr:siderophore-iron reductase FhuF [Rhizobium sp. LCM 4573]OHV82933.1 siderophore-iron reductase FhuF [Rhizobium sp. LCM 4573]